MAIARGRTTCWEHQLRPRRPYQLGSTRHRPTHSCHGRHRRRDNTKRRRRATVTTHRGAHCVPHTLASGGRRPAPRKREPARSELVNNVACACMYTTHGPHTLSTKCPHHRRGSSKKLLPCLGNVVGQRLAFSMTGIFYYFHISDTSASLLSFVQMCAALCAFLSRQLY